MAARSQSHRRCCTRIGRRAVRRSTHPDGKSHHCHQQQQLNDVVIVVVVGAALKSLLLQVIIGTFFFPPSTQNSLTALERWTGLLYHLVHF